jgi:hypothetical protein
MISVGFAGPVLSGAEVLECQQISDLVEGHLVLPLNPLKGTSFCIQQK